MATELQVSYLRKPLSQGRPVSELIPESDLLERILRRPDIRAYTDHIWGAPDAATKVPVHSARKTDKKGGLHALAIFAKERLTRRPHSLLTPSTAATMTAMSRTMPPGPGTIHSRRGESGNGDGSAAGGVV